jgi:hypothetical protein
MSYASYNVLMIPFCTCGRCLSSDSRTLFTRGYGNIYPKILQQNYSSVFVRKLVFVMNTAEIVIT